MSELGFATREDGCGFDGIQGCGGGALNKCGYEASTCGAEVRGEVGHDRTWGRV
jgi:hypothetical protein